jgi:predicted transcriptional regulator
MFINAPNRLLQNCFLGNGLLLPQRYCNMLRMVKVSDRNRSKFEIIAEILKQLRLPTCKTNIMSHCNMSSIQSGQYLNLISSNDLIRINVIAGKVTYQRTATGREFLEIYNRMLLLLDSSILPLP